MSEKNLEQWDKHNQVLLNGIDGSRKDEKMCKMTQKVGRQKLVGQMQMWTEYEPLCTQIED
jgi:hypothetical protein